MKPRREISKLNFILNTLYFKLYFLRISLNSCQFLGHIYTGTHDGKIMDIEQNKIRILTQLGKPPCGNKIYINN